MEALVSWETNKGLRAICADKNVIRKTLSGFLQKVGHNLVELKLSIIFIKNNLFSKY